MTTMSVGSTAAASSTKVEYFVSCGSSDGGPERVVGDDEVGHLWIARKDLVAEPHGKSLNFLFVDVTDALEEEERKNVTAELGVVNVPSQDVCGAV